MFNINIIGGKAVIEGVHKASKETRNGAVDGVRLATKDLAVDVARHTPVKTGKARDSVIGRVSQNGQTGRVTYDYKKRGAFYMRMILLGTKRHKITNRLKTKRGLAAAQRVADRKAARLGRSVAAKVTRRKALAIVVGGRVLFRASANHPGLKFNHILTDRLTANQQKIFGTISKSVAKRLAPFGR